MQTLLVECPRALLQRFIDVCWSLNYQPELELYTRSDEQWNALPGPVFRCDMLVDTSCDEQCDWDRLVSKPYDFNAKEKFSYDDLFLRDVGESSTGNAITVVKHMQLAKEDQGEAFSQVALTCGSCTVPGCEKVFPEAQKKWIDVREQTWAQSLMGS